MHVHAHRAYTHSACTWRVCIVRPRLRGLGRRAERRVELGDEGGARLVDRIPHAGEHGARSGGEEGARHAEHRVVREVAARTVRPREHHRRVRAEVGLAHRVHEEQALVERRRVLRRLLGALLGDGGAGARLGVGVGHRGCEREAAGP
eukprot:scaffold47086_cov60-Phaeocystis_antarctica.AAC.1